MEVFVILRLSSLKTAIAIRVQILEVVYVSLYAHALNKYMNSFSPTPPSPERQG